jgi:hypothetical protein
MDSIFTTILDQLTDARAKIGAEVVRLDALIQERDAMIGELERVDAAINALKKGTTVDAPPPIETTETNGTNGHARPKRSKGKTTRKASPAAQIEQYEGSLGKVVRLLERKKSALSARAIHEKIAPKGTHESATYGVLKRAIELGAVRRTGDQGAYRFELARQ